MTTIGTTEQSAIGGVDPAQIIRDLDVPWSGTLPVAAMRAAQQHRDLMIPLLIQTIRNASASARAGTVPPGNGHFLALFLLAEFRAKQALPAVLEAISLPGHWPLDLFGDVIIDSLPELLLPLATDPLETLDSLLPQTSLNEYVRWGAAQGFLSLVRDGFLTRDQAVERLTGHLREAIRTRDGVMAQAVVSELLSYSPREAVAEIQEAFRMEHFDLLVVDSKDLEYSLAAGEARFLQEMACCEDNVIDDAVDELQTWASYYKPANDPFFPESPDDSIDSIDDLDWPAAPDEWPIDDMSATIRKQTPHVGRNDPCPCGSGKKFKKCCSGK